MTMQVHVRCNGCGEEYEVKVTAQTSYAVCPHCKQNNAVKRSGTGEGFCKSCGWALDEHRWAKTPDLANWCPE
jgi:ribosomal protein L37AE/L43A